VRPDAPDAGGADTRGTMTEHSTLDRLETRLDLLVARVEALERRGPPAEEVEDALFELVQIEDSPLVREKLHVGEATGV
jgi:hypothetical protein